MGANTIEEIIEKAKSRNYEYVGFSDHNPSTSNNTERDIIEIMRKRKEYIDKRLAKEKFQYFIGLEVDIDPNGKLALPEPAIEYVDYLIVSVHSAFRQNKEEATRRVLKALSYPKVKIFGHPTGRMLGRRDGLEYDWEKIFNFVKEKDIAIEVNSGPERLDLPDSLVREAVKSKVKLMVDTDAHHTDWMDGITYGVSVARRGWAEKGDIMNTRGANEFKQWLTRY
jgi:DNA polymerase (family X)